MTGSNTILIVDDEKEICILLASIIKRSNIRPVFVHTIADAKKAVESENPELLFLDVTMPDGSGLDLLSDLMLQHPLLKIVIISAFDSYENTAANRGAYRFLQKPFNKEAVMEILEAVS
ncbi:MAG TPA: response regulator [Cyclobacteriaceae bacterium]|jgi:two-component system response regulator PilR (NtrC family)/two-component system KDP operon response regulator KdpE|nr:response regulator [Cyclobacteriaceae bacterium]